MWNKTLAAYLPMDRCHALSRQKGLPEESEGAVLLADLSGFTPLTERLTRQLGPRRGAEEIARQINQVYDALLPCVHRYRGSVVGFAGDAIGCYFDQDEGRRALASALAMQAAMAAFEAIPLPDGQPYTLGLKVGIAQGRVQRFLVGNPTIQVLEALTGRTLERMASAEHYARQGDVVLEGNCARRLAAQLEIREWSPCGRHARIVALHNPPQPTPWPELALETLPAERLRPWVHPVVYERLQQGQGEFLTELRPAVALFLRFEGIDYDHDREASAKLDAFVRWVQEQANAYGGTLLDLMVEEKGSYLYLVFGAPTAHEHTVFDALQTAQQLCCPPRTLTYIEQIQIGISQGTMRVGAYGGTLRRAYSALGDEVNLAVRLMEHAGAGEVLVSQRIQAAVGDRARWIAQAALQVKGKRDPFPVFTLVELHPHTPHTSQSDRYHLPLVGREAELAQIEIQLTRTLAGKGQVIGITGEAGIGKSRLIAEVLQRAQAQGMRIYSGACHVYGSHQPYVPWQPIWRALFGLGEEVPVASQQATLAAALRRLEPAFLPRLPLLAEILDLPLEDNELTRAFDPALRKQSREALLVEVLRRQAAQGPLLIVLEDLHWLDPLSYDLLQAVAHAIWKAPICLLLAYRPTETRPLKEIPHLQELLLSPLPTHEAEKVLHSLWQEQAGSKFPHALRQQLLARAQGNPFYLEELTAFLQGRLDHVDSTVEWPVSVESLILSRLDQLEEQERLLLKVASVVGRHFPASWLWGCYPPLAEQAGAKALAHLTERELLVEERMEPEPRYHFRHVLTQEVTYANLPHATRTHLHDAMAHYLEAEAAGAEEHLELLAYHYERGADQARARPYLLAAAERAEAAYDNASAQVYYERLLARLEEPQAQLEIRLRLGALLELVGEWQAAESYYHTARNQATEYGEMEALARSEHALGQLQEKRGEYEAAHRWLQQAQAHWTELERADKVSEILVDLGVLARRQSDFARARARLEESLQQCRAREDQRGQALALNELGSVAYDQREYEAARRAYEESLSLYRALGDRRGVADVLNNLGNVAYEEGDYAGARALHEESLARRREIGDKLGIARSLNNLGNAASVQQDYEPACTFYEECLGLVRDLGHRLGISYCLGNLGLVAYARGEYEKARHYHEESLALAREMGDQHGVAYSTENLGLVATTQGRPEEARHFYHESLRLCQDLGLHSLSALTILGVTMLLSQKDAPRSTRLLAALQQLLVAHEIRLEPIHQALFDNTEAHLRAQLTSSFAHQWQAGKAMELEQIVPASLDALEL